MDSSQDTELLCRAAANHLFLAQYEPFRAILQTLRARNPDLARSILQTIVAKGGQFDSVQWSSHPSCPSPALLTFLCTLELLQFNDPTSQLWSFDHNTLKLRAEFLLYIQMIVSRVSESVKEARDLEGSETGDKGIEVSGEKGIEGFEEKGEKVVERDEFRGTEGELDVCLRVLERVGVLGLDRLSPDLIVEDGEGESRVGGGGELREEDIMCLRRVVLEYADVFDILCENIRLQVGWVEKEEEEESSSMAIMLRAEGRRRETEEEEVLKLMQRCFQTLHLDAIKECLEKDDVDGAISHLRFLHLGYGVDETEYRKVLQHLLKRILSGKDDYGDTWLANRDKLLSVYAEMLSSCCISLVQLVQVIQDELLSEKIEALRSSDNDKIPYPLWRLQNFISELKPDTDSNDNTSLLNIATTSCMREMYHYARVRGLHVLESIMDTALSAVRKEQLQEASNVLSLFPRLQPLVAVMGWDLLSGKTTLRRKLMQLLWTSKSQAFRLEESHFYSNESAEVSCIEHLCDLLCYQLDLASFVACVNSGQLWSLKSSSLLSGKESIETAHEDVQWDPFVENFVLERLSVQSPLRVRWEVMP